MKKKIPPVGFEIKTSANDHHLSLVLCQANYKATRKCKRAHNCCIRKCFQISTHFLIRFNFSVIMALGCHCTRMLFFATCSAALLDKLSRNVAKTREVLNFFCNSQRDFSLKDKVQRGVLETNFIRSLSGNGSRQCYVTL